MAAATWWWVLAGAAVLLELVTGTFYLLMLALGLASGALVAHAGAALPGQLVTAALVGGGAVGAWALVRSRRPASPAPAGNRDLNLDIGEQVQVDAWKSDGTAQVRHRGAWWTAEAAPGSSPAPGLHRIREIAGSRLVLEKS